MFRPLNILCELTAFLIIPVYLECNIKSIDSGKIPLLPSDVGNVFLMRSALLHMLLFCMTFM